MAYTQDQIAAIFAEAETTNKDVTDPVFRAALNYAYLTGRFGIDTTLYGGAS